MSRKHVVVLDFDGTLVEAKWPEIGDWLPGAIENCRKLHEAGVHLVLFSARLSPYDPFTFQLRDPAHAAAEQQKVRAKLDEAGLTFIDIWNLPGKPGAAVYVDDKAERYNGGAKSWDKLFEKILMRLDKEELIFPIFDQEAANG